jgi:hypothetical protein
MKIKGKEDLDIDIRPIKETDYPELIKWWKLYENYGVVIPRRSLLPDKGLGGYVVEKEGRLVASCFLYLTNSALGYVDYLIADPTYREEDRLELLLDLATRVTAVAIDNGCESVWAMTSNKNVNNLFTPDNGFYMEPGDYKLVRTANFNWRDAQPSVGEIVSSFIK